MKVKTHIFDTQDEADAFALGVDWINASAITFIEGFDAGDDDSGWTYGLVYEDSDDSGADEVYSHQK